MPIELKGLNYYSKVFKRINYRLSNNTFWVVITSNVVCLRTLVCRCVILNYNSEGIKNMNFGLPLTIYISIIQNFHANSYITFIYLFFNISLSYYFSYLIFFDIKKCLKACTLCFELLGLKGAKIIFLPFCLQEH